MNASLNWKISLLLDPVVKRSKPICWCCFAYMLVKHQTLLTSIIGYTPSINKHQSYMALDVHCVYIYFYSGDAVKFNNMRLGSSHRSYFQLLPAHTFSYHSYAYVIKITWLLYISFLVIHEHLATSCLGSIQASIHLSLIFHSHASHLYYAML
jgi:hypothetical protein